MKLFHRLLLALILLFSFSGVYAQSDPALRRELDGSKGEFAIDSFRVVEDPKFFDASLNSVLVKPYPVINKVGVKIYEQSPYLIQSNFQVTVGVVIVGTRADNTTFTHNKNYTINYRASGDYGHDFAFYFEEFYRVSAKITSISSDVPWDVTKVLTLYNEIQSTPKYSFNCTSDAIATITAETLPSNTDKDQIEITWPQSTNAHEYDLEWTYIDWRALQDGLYGSPLNPNTALIFRDNASRVTIKANKYKIPLIYDSKGTLFFRVRPAQIFGDGSRYAANWSTQVGQFPFDGHQRNLNWQATTTYAEDGKRKTVVQYYDGSLRSRQTVTKDNETDTTIIAESFYDYQGRPVIQVLPSPSLSNIIQYTQGFNVGLNAAEYYKEEYDELLDSSEYCTLTAKPMSTASGASQYYSPDNPLAARGIHRFIPDAKQFPFSQVEYMPDNTGRISRQGGVGPSFQLGSGHETKYYYGTPDQKELDALFGTEVGLASHYFKTMVRDANGQYSVSYTDMRGRTIATALAGAPPDSIRLDKLPSYDSAMITESLSEVSSTVIKDLVMESKKGLLVAKPGLHTFNYQLSPQSLQMEGCDTTTFCYDCLYDLRITITDDCNNQKLGGRAFDTTISNFSLASIDTTCLNGAPQFNFSFVKFLPEGSYDITKQLSVSPQAMRYYDSLFAVRNMCRTIDSFIVEQRQLLQQQLDCAPSCASCEAEVASYATFRSNYLTKTGIAPGEAAQYESQISKAFLQAVASCNELCNKISDVEDIRSAMLQDLMPPSGQYANRQRSDSPYSIFYATPSVTPAYKRATNYLDADGNPARVYDETADGEVTPQQLSEEAFEEKFQPSWAEALLPSHPEYCKLQQIEAPANKQAFEWERRFETVTTYTEAYQQGYLNPLDNTTPFLTRYTHWSMGSHPDMDPVNVTGVPLRPIVATLQAMMIGYRTYTDQNNTVQSLSMWAMATISAKCSTTTAACILQYSDDDNAFDPQTMTPAQLDRAWNIFKQYYLEARRKLVSNKIADLCANSAPSTPSATTLMNEGYTSHFGTSDEQFDAAGIDLPTTQAEAETQYAQANASQTAEYSSTCNAYANYWIRELSGCQYTQAQLDILIPRLVQVCVEGSDVNHPFGANTVKPSSTSPYRSFEEVVKEFNTSIGRSTNAACNIYSVTAPKPYHLQPAYSEKTIYGTPDSCECTKINTVYGEWENSTQNQLSSFKNFIKQKYKTEVDSALLSQLVGFCNDQDSTQSINGSLPSIFQCFNDQACVTCSVMDSLTNEFVQLYPGNRPVNNRSSEDSVQLVNNVFYTKFLNYRLAFTKSSAEYFDFLASCKLKIFTVGCDSLQLLKESFLSQRDTTQSSSACRQAFVNFINQRWQSSFKYSQIDSIYLKNCGTRISICPSTDTVNTYSCDSLQTILKKFNVNANPYRVVTFLQTNALPGGTLIINTPASIIENGYMRWPDSLRQRNDKDWVYHQYAIAGPSKMCFEKGYIIELSLKHLRNVVHNNDDLFYYTDGNLRFTLCKRTTAPVGLFVREIVAGSQSLFSGLQLLSTDSNAIFNQWNQIRVAVASSKIDFYYNGVLKKAITRPEQVLSNPGAFTAAFFSYQGAMDYVRIYDADGYVKYFESFNSSDNRATMKPSMVCPLPSNPTGTFLNYFNQQVAKTYSYSQIDSIYFRTCGSNLDLFDDSTEFRSQLSLCGRSEPVFPSVNVNLVNNCYDSTFIIDSKSTELYRVYSDSLHGHFDSSYRAKCLEAYKYESFTVSHAQSEYHYTLYYYDQAGNLVKTVPPAGVAINRNALWLDSVEVARAAGLIKTPLHQLETNYRYNTLNQVVTQKTPDAGKSEFWYDRLGRLALSRNAQQKLSGDQQTAGIYSYTKYDELGRITEVGQVKDAANSTVNQLFTRNPQGLQDWLLSLDNNREQFTNTIYDLAYPSFAGIDNRLIVQQKNLRNRVSYSTYADAPSMNAYNHATFYSYDIHGNVDTLLQDFGFSGLAATANAMNKNNNRFKKTSYNYDLISGKVNLVMYRRGWNDQVLHRYSYDAENRLKLVETSFDSLRWETDARYEYYRHGPLARMVLGDQLLQGVDYAYTLQGWLKGVNSIALTTEKDMGQDGLASTSNAPVARDVYGYQLNYFTADYAPINPSVDPLPGLSGLIPAQEYRPLYNGNISSMAVHQKALTGSSVVGPSALLYNYRYDQLNRLTGMDAYKELNTGNPLIFLDQFQEKIAYDANGNILKYLRNGHLTAANVRMDSLSYKYYPNTNQLRRVADSVPAGSYGNLSADLKDIDPQTDLSNYKYDAIGNLVKDVQEGITDIKWTVYGKIKQLTRVQGTTTTEIFYGYDPQGNRVSKLVQRNANGTLSKDYTYYVRDAQGNVMATYFASGTGSLETLNLQLSERHFYGSSRLGYYNHKVSVDVGDLGPSPMIKPASNKYSRGYRQYELSNHLGNVLTVLMDKRLGIDNTSDGQIDYYDAVVTSANDYYPFGSMMPGRRFTSANTYRYGFNGKEEDDEVKGDGNSVDMGDRWLDVRLCRTSKPDAKGSMFPNVSPYAFAMNSPLNAVDPDGKVVIFINGYYGFPTAACCGGTEKHWGREWVSRAQKQIGDKKSRFYDGSLGGPSGALFGQGDPVIGNSSSMDPATRRLAGYNLGRLEAADIVNNLERDAHGNITESIKFITSSMGTAFQRGFSKAILDYVGEQNAIIDAYNNNLKKNEDGSYQNPSLVKLRLNVTIEFTVDLDAFQGSELTSDPNSKANYYMINDGIESNFIGSAVPGSKQIGIDEKGKSTMRGHHPSWADTKALPKGTQNPIGSDKKENPSD